MIRALLTGVGAIAHESCNLGNNPGHAVVTRKNNTDIDNIITILTTMSDFYGSKQTDWTKFQLFNSTKYGDGSNLLFKDSTTELRAIASDKRNYNDYLGKDYGENKAVMGECANTTTTVPPTSVSTSYRTVAPILLIALLGVAQRFL